MTEIFSDSEPVVVGFLQSQLETAGIPCFVRNQHTDASYQSVLFWPTLCITDEGDLDAALSIVSAFALARKAGTQIQGKDWECAQCGERVPASLGECWNCTTPGANNEP